MPYIKTYESIMDAIDEQNRMCAMLDGALNVRVSEVTFEGTEEDLLELLKHNCMPNTCLFGDSNASYNSMVNNVPCTAEIKFKVVAQNPVKHMIWFTCDVKKFEVKEVE